MLAQKLPNFRKGGRGGFWEVCVLTAQHSLSRQHDVNAKMFGVGVALSPLILHKCTLPFAFLGKMERTPTF